MVDLTIVFCIINIELFKSDFLKLASGNFHELPVIFMNSPVDFMNGFIIFLCI